MSPQTSKKPARIFLVDDHPAMRRGLAQIIDDASDLEVCGEAAGLEDAFAQIRDLRPDLMVVDITLQEGPGGIELIKDAKEQYPDIPSLVLSMHDESLFAERVLRAGARGYINKHEPPETVVEAIRNVLAGRVALSPKMTDRLLNQMTVGQHDPASSPLEALTDRELEVFEMIGHGLNTKQIAAKLGLSHKTIETYREHIKTKLNLGHSAELAQHAVQWVLEGR